MAIKTWPNLDDKELVAHAEVRDAVNRGILEWLGGVEPIIPTDNTGLNPDKRCYTRSDFESYVRHVDMSGSGIEMGEYMSKSEMLTYRMILGPIPIPSITLSTTSPYTIVVSLSATGVFHGYILEYRIEGSGDWTEHNIIASGSTQYNHTTLPEATLVHYRARCYRNEPPGTIYSSYSTESSIRTHTESPGNSPSNATLSINHVTIHDTSTWRAVVNWSDNSNNETGFQIQRLVGESGSWSSRGTVSANSTSFNDGLIDELTQYRYRVRAIRTVNGQDEVSTWSTTSTVRSRASAPSDLTAVALTPTQVSLTWNNTSTADKIRIYRNGSTSPLTTVDRSSSPSQSLLVSAVAGTLNEYDVRAYDTNTNTESFGAIVTVSTSQFPSLTSASWIRSNIQLCPSLDETHCVRWDGGNLTKPGYHVAIYRSVNGGSFSKVRDNVSPTSTPNCTGGTGTYGTSLNLTYGLDTGFLGNFNDVYQYQVRIEEDGTDNAVSTATTAEGSSLHSDCIL